MNDEEKKETPAAKALRRTGPCIAQICTDPCLVFAYDKYEDGFRICVCGHTQHAHAYGEEK